MPPENLVWMDPDTCVPCERGRPNGHQAILVWSFHYTAKLECGWQKNRIANRWKDWDAAFESINRLAVAGLPFSHHGAEGDGHDSPSRERKVDEPPIGFAAAELRGSADRNLLNYTYGCAGLVGNNYIGVDARESGWNASI